MGTARLQDVVDLDAIALLAIRKHWIHDAKRRRGVRLEVEAATERILPVLAGMKTSVALIALGRIARLVEDPFRSAALMAAADVREAADGAGEVDLG